MDYTVRKVTIHDYDAIYELWNSTEQSRRALNPVDDSREGIERYLKRNPNTCFAAVKEASAPVGTGGSCRTSMIISVETYCVSQDILLMTERMMR